MLLSPLCRVSVSMNISGIHTKLFRSSSDMIIPVSLPSPRETHFWYVIPDEVKDASLLSRYLHLLSPCEKENVFRMRGDNLQKRALLARTLVRTTLARYTNSLVSPSSLKFRKNTFGKSEVEWQFDNNWDPPSLHFNLSHTSSLIACGVTVDMMIGIDVEEKQRQTKNDLLSFARRYFSPAEADYLDGFPDPEVQRHEFIKIWTLKEAYVKALGKGFSASPFKTFTIRFKGCNESRLQMSGDSNYEYEASKIEVVPHGVPKYHSTNWKFALFELVNSYYAAICVENKIRGDNIDALKVKVWKTLPLVKDDFVSATDSIRPIAGFT